MKIALIRPNMGNYRSSDAMTPLAMGILAGRSTGHEVVFYDDRVEPVPERIDADLVAISVETFTARRAYQIADQLRAQGTRVVLGGYHPTLLPQEAAAHADALITGDAEDVWAQLLHDAQCNQLQALYASPNRHDLTDYAMDRRIFANKRYAPIELVQYGRGCRFACDFCSIHRFYGHHVRVRPAADVRAELEQLNRKRLLFFVDDNLFNTETQLLQLLDAIAPLRMRWSCQISIDVARNQHLLDRLAAAGCRYVLIGFESMERANLKQMGKGWNHVAGSYRDVVRALHQRGIGIYGTFVFGYDHDTVDTIARSLDFALEAELDIANFNPLTPTPGSALYERLRQENRLISPQWWLDPHYRYGDPIFTPASMSAHDMTQGCFDAKQRFYAWSSIAKRVWGHRKTPQPFQPDHRRHCQHHLAARGVPQARPNAWGLSRE